MEEGARERGPGKGSGFGRVRWLGMGFGQGRAGAAMRRKMATTRAARGHVDPSLALLFGVRVFASWKPQEISRSDGTRGFLLPRAKLSLAETASSQRTRRLITWPNADYHG